MNKRKKIRVAVWHWKQEMQVARARVYPERENEVVLPLRPLEFWGTVQSTLCAGGCCREIFSPAMCSLQFAKASAAILRQQKKNDSADVQRGRLNISNLICTVVS